MASTPITLAPPAAREGAGEGPAVDLGDRATVRLTLDVTSCASPLHVSIETSDTTAGPWRELFVARAGLRGSAGFSATGEARRERLAFPGCDRYVRARWTAHGTAAFSIEGEVV